MSRTHEQALPTLRVAYDWSGPEMGVTVETADNLANRAATYCMQYDSGEDRQRILGEIIVAADAATTETRMLGPHRDDVVAAVVATLRGYPGDVPEVLSLVADEYGLRDEMVERLVGGALSP